ncbi:MAG: hypothetical protein GC154_16970 [bacterium]|nr:hypothetical protein [bacterium]
MNLLKKIVFGGLLIYLVTAAMIGTAALAFTILEWRATPKVKKDELIDPSKVDLAPDLVPYVMFGSPPNTEWHDVFMPAAEGDESAPTIKLNDHRFRYGPLEESKPAGGLRLFTLGGSVVFYGHDNESTIAGRLEAALKSKYQNRTVEVVNAGVTGYISDQELILLITDILDFDPDFVIVFDGFNDFLMPTAYEPRLGYPFKFETLEVSWYESKDLLRRLSDLPLTSHLLAGSHFMRQFSPDWSYVRYLRSKNIDGKEKPPAPGPEAIANHLVENWRKMGQFLKANGVGGLIVLQPFRDAATETYKPHYDAVEAAIPGLQAEFENADPPIRFLSYRHTMEGKEDWFYDVVHTYDKGNDYYAQLLMNDLPEMK